MTRCATREWVFRYQVTGILCEHSQLPVKTSNELFGILALYQNQRGAANHECTVSGDIFPGTKEAISTSRKVRG